MVQRGLIQLDRDILLDKLKAYLYQQLIFAENTVSSLLMLAA